MTAQITTSLLLATALSWPAVSVAQNTTTSRFSNRLIDSQNGLSLDDAVHQALEREPALRAARSDVDVAQGKRLQATLRPNPVISFEQRQQPTGTDNQTMAQVQWPLDLFRRPARLEAAD